MSVAPLILTLQLDPVAQARFDAERAAHFPPERNYLSAHLTLFHHLPGEAIDEVDDRLHRASAAQGSFALEVVGLWMMGRGVAYQLRAPALVQLRAGLAEAWRGWLTPQDRQPLRPHITIQNKVDAGQARALHQSLQAGFAPFEVRGVGLLLWHYQGGPWTPAAAYPFRGG